MAKKKGKRTLRGGSNSKKGKRKYYEGGSRY